MTSPQAEPTGDAATPTEPDVEQLLAGLVDRPLDEHAAVFEQVHGRLQDSLARIDSA